MRLTCVEPLKLELLLDLFYRMLYFICAIPPVLFFMCAKFAGFILEPRILFFELFQPPVFIYLESPLGSEFSTESARATYFFKFAQFFADVHWAGVDVALVSFDHRTSTVVLPKELPDSRLEHDVIARLEIGLDLPRLVE